MRNWHRDADRTSNGYYKGISLAQAGGTGTGSSGGSGGGVVSSAESVDQY